MYNLIKLSLKNINTFRKISKINTNFNSLDKDFFLQYDKYNIIQKIFLRKNVYLLLEKQEDNSQINYIGYIWFERYNKHHSFINSIKVIGSTNLISCYKNLFNTLSDSKLISYECERNEVNTDILLELGFKITKGVMELEKKCVESLNEYLPKDITFSMVEKDKDEKVRCLLQNEIFKNNNRTPIHIEDIYYDEAQEYYFSEGAIFIKLGGTPIGYGQIILEDNKAIIVNFGIIEKYRKEGYGKALLNYLLNVAMDNNFSKVSLKVDSGNKAALNLYFSLGFNIKSEFCTWQKIKDI